MNRFSVACLSVALSAGLTLADATDYCRVTVGGKLTGYCSSISGTCESGPSSDCKKGRRARVVKTGSCDGVAFYDPRKPCTINKRREGWIPERETYLPGMQIR